MAIAKINNWMLRIFPAPTAEIAIALQNAQLDDVRRNAPMLLAVGALNAVIIMATCAQSGMPLMSYGWICIFVLGCIIRIIMVRRSYSKPAEILRPESYLRITTLVAAGNMGLLGIFGSFAFLTGLFSFAILVPVSLAFGATAIAQCLYTLRKTAVAALLFGIAPVAITMMIAGNFETKMLGLAMLSIEALMIRFVIQQYDVLIGRLSIEEEFRRFANTDALTNIANRRAIMAQLDNLEKQQKPGESFAIALLDLDGFKAINDKLGHNIGDSVLQHVASCLTESALPGDKAGRLGGDEFILIFNNIGGPNDLTARAAKMIAHLSEPLVVEGNLIPVGASIGYAAFPKDGRTSSELLHAADMALYSDKRKRKQSSSGTMANMTGLKAV